MAKTNAFLCISIISTNLCPWMNLVTYFNCNNVINMRHCYIKIKCSCRFLNVNYTITSTLGAEWKKRERIAHAQCVPPRSPSQCPIARDRIVWSAAQHSSSPQQENNGRKMHRKNLAEMLFISVVTVKHFVLFKCNCANVILGILWDTSVNWKGVRYGGIWRVTRCSLGLWPGFCGSRFT